MWRTYGTENQNLYTLPTTTFLDTNCAAGLPSVGKDPSSRSVNCPCECTLATECLTALITGKLWGQRACQRRNVGLWLIESNGLNGCLSPEFPCWNPNLGHDGMWGWGGSGPAGGALRWDGMQPGRKCPAGLTIAVWISVPGVMLQQPDPMNTKVPQRNWKKQSWWRNTGLHFANQNPKYVGFFARNILDRWT